jgi:hypothetical protein
MQEVEGKERGKERSWGKFSFVAKEEGLRTFPREKEREDGGGENALKRTFPHPSPSPGSERKQRPDLGKRISSAKQKNTCYYKANVNKKQLYHIQQ